MSETLTQTLARNPILGSALVRGDAVPVLDVSATGLGKDAMATMLELMKALATRGAHANSTGNSTVTPGACAIQHTEIITLTGSAGTRKIILDVANAPTAGARCLVRIECPATAGLLLDFRNATAGGTQLTTAETDGSGDDMVAEFGGTGTAWEFLRFHNPANA